MNKLIFKLNNSACLCTDFNKKKKKKKKNLYNQNIVFSKKNSG